MHWAIIRVKSEQLTQTPSRRVYRAKGGLPIHSEWLDLFKYDAFESHCTWRGTSPGGGAAMSKTHLNKLN